MSLVITRKVIEDSLLFHYQPIIDIESGLTLGHELLARLSIDDRILSPFFFIEQVERLNLFDVFDTLLESACANYFARFPKNFVSINIPTLESLMFHLQSDIMISHSSNVHLELLESIEWSDPNFSDSLDLAFDLGFHLYLDDFGSGLSNLKTLAHPAITGVKFDRSILLLFAKQANDGMLERLVDLVLSMDKSVVFEGVETADQHDYLQRISNKCYCQGYLYGKPDGIKFSA